MLLYIPTDMLFLQLRPLNHGKNMCLMQSLGKYNLNCYASESQLQEYTSGKFREFMAQPTGEDEWPIKIAVKAVGLQEVNANDSTVQEIELRSEVKVWVFNRLTHINEDGKHFFQRKIHSYGSVIC